MNNCDREDFDFHYTYELHDGVVKKLNVVEEIVDSWRLEDAPEEGLFAALDEVRPEDDYSDEVTREEILEFMKNEL